MNPDTLKHAKDDTVEQSKTNHSAIRLKTIQGYKVEHGILKHYMVKCHTAKHITVNYGKVKTRAVNQETSCRREL